MNPQTLVLIGLAIVGIFAYSKIAAAKSTSGQAPQLITQSGSVVNSLLNSLGIATQAISPTVSSAAQAAAYTADTTAPSLTISQIVSGQDTGATPSQLAYANQYEQVLNQSVGSLPDNAGMVDTSATLYAQD